MLLLVLLLVVLVLVVVVLLLARRRLRGGEAVGDAVAMLAMLVVAAWSPRRTRSTCPGWRNTCPRWVGELGRFIGLASPPSHIYTLLS